MRSRVPLLVTRVGRCRVSDALLAMPPACLAAICARRISVFLQTKQMDPLYVERWKPHSEHSLRQPASAQSLSLLCFFAPQWWSFLPPANLLGISEMALPLFFEPSWRLDPSGWSPRTDVSGAF